MLGVNPITKFLRQLCRENGGLSQIWRISQDDFYVPVIQPHILALEKSVFGKKVLSFHGVKQFGGAGSRG